MTVRGAAIAAVLAVAVLAGTATAQTVTITTFAQLREYAFRTATRLLGVEQRVVALEARVAALEQRDQAWSNYAALQACIWNGTYQGSTVLRAIPGLGPYQLPTGYQCPPTAPAAFAMLPLRPR